MFKLTRNLSFIALAAVLQTMAPAAHARDKKVTIAPKDDIEVVGHIPLSGGPVRKFFTTQHFSSFYLYAEHDAGKNVTLIDVTRTSSPAVLADVAYPGNAGGSSLSAVAGTAALVTSEPAVPAAASAPQTIRIMDLSDPQHPKVAREFAGVTALSKDDKRGLIFVANSDGIWILRQHLAEDPDVVKAYADYVVYGPSMFAPHR